MSAPRDARRVAVFDLDGTLSWRDLYLAFLVEGLARGPARPLAAAALPLAVLRFRAGRLGNDGLKTAFLGAVHGGRPRAAVEAAARRFADRAAARLLKPAALAALAGHRAAGDGLLLASASLDLYALPLAEALGFHHAVATRAAWTAEGRLSGGLDGPNLRGEAKVTAVRAALADRFPAARELVAYTDHESDLPLLELADRPVAVDPTRRLAALAAARGWPVADWRRPGGPLRTPPAAPAGAGR